MHTGVPVREFEWEDADFKKVQKLIYQHAGISLHDGKHAMVYSRLSRRLRETGYQSFKAYLSWLESSDGPEWQEFVNALTTNLTSFFRERHHFEILHDHLLEKNQTRDWKLWCCAASTGEEPYSIVMTMMDALHGDKSFSLIASDIDSKVLNTASQGIYRLNDLKNVSPVQMKTYFLRGNNTNSGLVRIKPEVQNFIRFIHLNLIDDHWPLDKTLFDIVFCRNVMIYFDHTTQRKVLERIHRHMVPGGLLFVGHAENFSDLHSLFVMRGKTVYERL